MKQWQFHLTELQRRRPAQYRRRTDRLKSLASDRISENNQLIAYNHAYNATVRKKQKHTDRKKLYNWWEECQKLKEKRNPEN